MYIKINRKAVLMGSVEQSLGLYAKIRGAIKGIAQDIASVEEIPGKTRKEYLDIIDETMTLLCTSLEMVMTRLQDLLILARGTDADQKKFISELRNLDYFDDWIRAEREFRLCRNLRWRAREMSGLIDRFKLRIALRDRKAFGDSVDGILKTETELAGFISGSLIDIANLADSAEESDEKYQEVIEEVRKTRDAFRSERNKLVEDQIEIGKLV